MVVPTMPVGVPETDIVASVPVNVWALIVPPGWKPPLLFAVAETVPLGVPFTLIVAAVPEKVGFETVPFG